MLLWGLPLPLLLVACATSDEYRGPGPGSPWRRCASEGDRGSYPAADRPLVYFFCYESP
jgi:hypothetical protein